MFSKYSNTKVKIDGLIFPSELESEVYMMLKDIHDCGAMANLKLQVPYDLHGIDGKKVCRYDLDFLVELADGSTWAIEAKGVMTRVASLKIKLYKSEYGPIWVCKSDNKHLLKDILIELLSVSKAKRQKLFRHWLEIQTKTKKRK